MLIVVQQGGLGRKLRRLRKSSCLRIAFSQQGQAQPNLKFWTLKIPFWVRRQSGTPYTCESQSWAEWRRRRQFTYIELCLVRCKHWSVHLEIVILLHIGRRRGVGILALLLLLWRLLWRGRLLLPARLLPWLPLLPNELKGETLKARVGGWTGTGRRAEQTRPPSWTGGGRRNPGENNQKRGGNLPQNPRLRLSLKHGCGRGPM